MFDCGVLKSREFDIPIICVGNLSVGGTGKTPHTELIISELRKNYRVACLSRGYKRMTSGFIIATKQSTAVEVGDEALQLKLKFPDCIVACDEKRVRGIENLLQLPEEQRPQVIILDDAFQHRYVKAGKNILLMSHNQLVYKDLLLPAGRLRESKRGLLRADYIIVSKCPPDLKPIEKRLIYKHLKPKAYQKLFYTITTYGDICKLFTNVSNNSDFGSVPTATKMQDIQMSELKDAAILCVTGIAKPEPFIRYVKGFCAHVHEMRFPDHHNFTSQDTTRIISQFQQLNTSNKYVFTTEKDAMRLKFIDLPEDVKDRLFYIPITPTFLAKQDVFINELDEYVAKNQR
ncbi:tetraacyldisaccharide 4'-kinase [Bacteroidia bacterium]|nr:tetraacyldisaccharide 4'-kinase [Bacteroidia bacterium]